MDSQTKENNRPNKCGAKTQVYARVVGFCTPVQQWNDGKREEFSQRKTFDVNSRPKMGEFNET